MATRTIRMSKATALAHVLSSLDDDLSPFLERAGAILVSLAQRAFTDQRFGSEAWSERYPVQEPPKVNIAGLVSDLDRLGSVKDRRFVDRPALIHNGILQGSLSHALEPPNVVAYGTPIEYAALMHRGGVSRQLITEEIRKALNKFLKSARGAPYRDKLGFLFTVDELETRVGARPFIGITEEGHRDLIDELGDYIQELADEAP